MEQPQLRQDLVSQDWVLIAPKRSQRGNEKPIATRSQTPIESCPFEHILKEEALLYYGEGAQWRVVVIKNKYPALKHADVCPVRSAHGPYISMYGSGEHELLLTRDHTKNLSDLSMSESGEVFMALIERYKALADEKCMQYISIFQNWGASAGASQSHPHHQILALPVIPPHVKRSLYGARRYFDTHKRCAHCEIIAFERKENLRIIFENDDAIITAPYASKQAFEMKIYPKHHIPHFEKTPPHILVGVIEALRFSLTSLKQKLGNPDYNYFIHTGPVNNSTDHYHWHIEIHPRLNISAGFELSTQIVINPVAPEDAAILLRQ